MAAFQEVFRRSGIDERRSPPGMVVPFGGSNIVALIDTGRKLKVDPNPHALGIKEIDGADTLRRVVQARDTFSEPDIDPQLRAASLPATFNGDARFFEINGRIKPIGFPGLEVVARSAGRKIEARLHVAVLPEIKIKVAFRNVMVPGIGGTPAFHTKKPCNEQDELLTINSIWPQANIRFEPMPSDWLVIDDSQAALKQELANAAAMKDASLAAFPDVIEVEKLKSFFVKYKVKGAHLTIFCVDKLWSNGSSPNGSFARSLDLAFISSQRGPNTSAHEAGHFLGYYSKSASKPWDSHTVKTDPKTGKETGRKTSRC
ncbi:hypothetical protein GGD65_006918 [Bradyrhizobium sp. CIR18]|uniref:hypothetical protein n=1 Tax=Bradyrhizobium sp. CIR18 TaxID=2663839 RepID=UPI0018100D8E|nr:hypothetical protein [Bradyrhizobium sp. CIR18]MBB4365849.1 hypothetical protein [Bradyrhizobium sp. CIR18]